VSPRSRIREALLLASILLVTWLARWPFRDAVLIRDEGEYAYIGQRILEGEVPYRDIYNQKTPFVFYALAAEQALLGPDVARLRLFGSAYGLLTTSAVYVVARSAFGPLGAASAALSFSAMVFHQAGILHQASTEYFMLLWLALGVWAWRKASESGRPWLLAAAGALAGMACQTKQSGVVLLFFFAADALWRRRHAGRAALGAAAREFTWALAGFAAVFAAVIGLFAAQGALSDYVECAWRHLGGYVGGRYRDVREASALSRLIDAVEIAGWELGFWIAGAWGLYRLARRSRGAESGWWILGLGLSAAAILPGISYRHYYVPLALPLSLGFGALAGWRGERARVRRTLLGLAFCLPWLGPLLNGWDLLRMGPEGRALRMAAYAPFDRAEAVARYIAARTPADEPVLIVGSEPEIYYLAGRPAATRLIHTYTTTGPYVFAPALREEFLSDLREKRPRYVLLVNVGSSLTEWPEMLEAFLPPILETLREDYVVQERWAGSGEDIALRGLEDAMFVLWRRRDSRNTR